jgi:hypothetical protein
MKKLSIISLLLLTLLLQACGQSNKGEEKAESFSTLFHEASELEGTEVRTIESTPLQGEKKTNQPESIATLDTENKPTSGSGSASTKGIEVEKEVVETEKKIAIVTDQIIDPVQKKVEDKESSVALTSKEKVQKKDVEQTANDKSITAKNDQKVTANSDVSKQVGGTNSTEKSVPVKSVPETQTSGITSIGWSEFFDGEDQTTPSNRFWDLKGSTVTIKGFMGEVLSFDKNWLLLIPEPGAECPFDNGDETYWNKIMIVFVTDDVKLRYKSGPIQITGRLDTGIKIDESGYKTMFRIYDASLEEIQE